MKTALTLLLLCSWSCSSTSSETADAGAALEVQEPAASDTSSAPADEDIADTATPSPDEDIVDAVGPSPDAVIADAVAPTPDELQPPADTAPAPDAATVDTEHAILFVGNSFTFGNDLEALWASLHQSLAPDVKVDSRRVASAGYRLEQHLSDATTPTSTKALRELLVTAPPAWDFVVLQEQSQIPGFPPGQPEHDASVAAAVGLAGLAHAAGAETLLLETWGYRAGDATNPDLFGTFEVMQEALTAGYAEMAAAIAAAGYPVRVIPAGQAFAAAKLVDSALHSRLYTSDTRHPSVHGSYLAACALAALLAEDHVVGTTWAPVGISPEDAAALRAAAQAVFAD